jgi:hypothetical protein
MKKLFAAVCAAAIVLCAPFAARADTGSPRDAAAIRKLATVSKGPCPQRVSHVSAIGNYALATVEQRGSCDAAAVWVYARKGGAWHSTGVIGGVPDACAIHSRGVPLSIAPALIRVFTGTSDASLTSTKSCGG